MAVDFSKYDFDKPVNRRDTNSGKWDTMSRRYQRRDLIHLGVADMDFRSPPQIIEGFRRVMDTGVFGYTDLSDKFYAAIQRWYRRQHAIDVPREWILFCPRINIAAGLCVDAFTEKGDEVMIHTPAYGPLREAIVKNGRTQLSSPLLREGDRYAIDFDGMRRDITAKTKILVMCSPHNPTGRVYSVEELRRVGRFCVENNLLVFSDEIHGDIVRKGVPRSTMLNVDEETNQRLILASSPAKTFNVPGLIISYLIIPNADIRERVAAEIDRIGMHNPNVFAVSAVENAYMLCDDWYEAMTMYIDANEDRVREFFAAKLPGFRILDREGTYLLWIDYRSLGKSEEEVGEWFIKSARVEVYMGGVFGPEGEGYLRLNLATARGTLEEALARMAGAYDKLIGDPK